MGSTVEQYALSRKPSNRSCRAHWPVFCLMMWPTRVGSQQQNSELMCISRSALNEHSLVKAEALAFDAAQS